MEKRKVINGKNSMKLNSEKSSAIQSREAMNRFYIYLYPRHKGKAWIAYGQSALNLHLLLPHICFLSKHIEGVHQILPTIIIPQLSLDFLIEKGVDITDCDDGRNLRLKLPLEMQKKGYGLKVVNPIEVQPELEL